MLTQKAVPFSWGVTEVTAFQTLKDKMTTGPVLILPDLQKSFEVYCDACGRSLEAAFRKADTVGDILSQFHFQIVHVQGQKNVVADALSRKPLVQAISAIHHSSFKDMVDQYATYTDFADIFTRIRDGETVAGYSIQKGYLMRKTMLCVTQPLREKVMTECHCPPFTGHRGIATTMKGVERYFYWLRLKKDLKSLCAVACKQAHFIPIKKTVKPDHLARLFVAQIFRLHGMPGKAPFEIVEGGKKVLRILQTKDEIFEADKYVQNTDEAYRKIKLALEKTQSKQKKAADHHRCELVFSLGDWVLLRFEKARLRKMKGKEPLFPKLEDMVPEEQPEVEELDEILVPEQILAHKDRKVRGKVARRYLVKFKNYSPMDAKWMEEAELVDSPQLLQLYLEAFQLQPTVT
ncbi:hypothetical protein L7F22_034449 [Adiantum nelumboides]|nr:hypothetical protein [Adiantum nelumboides]